jgi:alkylated DNA repair protein (DNA oxidative demethylase)
VRPPGFRLLEDVVAPAEEAALLAWARGVPLAPYVMQRMASRRLVAPFGPTYRLGDTEVDEQPFPDALRPLADRCADLTGVPRGAIVQALVSRYVPGAGIGWHRDRPMFGPTVIGVSLAAPCRLRLRPRERPGDAVAIALPPRSVYVLSGEARTDWEHSIPPVKAERWSITLRTLAPRPSSTARRSSTRRGSGSGPRAGPSTASR